MTEAPCWTKSACNAEKERLADLMARALWPSSGISFGPTIFDEDIFAFMIPGLAQALMKSLQETNESLSWCAVQESDNRDCRWLRPRCHRPRSRRAAEQRDELAALHSITSSARTRIDVGTSRPSALAVLRLMISSTLVACWTGKSAGFSPLRIRPV